MEHYKTTYIVAKEQGTSQGIIDIKASAHDWQYKNGVEIISSTYYKINYIKISHRLNIF